MGSPCDKLAIIVSLTHFVTSENVARIALAVDYNGNGYRSLLPMAMQEPAILNAALALAASHHSRWQHTPDNVSRKYLRAASKALRDRFSTRDLVHSQVTLAAMLLLVSFEVCLFLLVLYSHPTMLFTMPMPIAPLILKH